MENNELIFKGAGSVVRGIFGAISGAVIFGAVFGVGEIIFNQYFVLLAAVLVSIGAFLGYRLFGGMKSLAAIIIICILCSAVSCIFWSIVINVYSLYGTYEYLPVKIALGNFFKEPDSALWTDVGFEVAACVIGFFAISGSVRKYSRALQKEETREEIKEETEGE